MDETQKAWVGALIEGEGSIGKNGRRVAVGSTDVETLATLLRFTGVGMIHLHPGSALGKKTMWYWIVSRKASVHDLLRQIAPWLTSKQELAYEVLT